MPKLKQATSADFPWCESCCSSTVPGVLLPCDASDREPSRDGFVQVERCDECDRYEDDVAAADAVAEATGWVVKRSYDYEQPGYDYTAHMHEATPMAYYRPYFDVTMAEVEALTMSRDSSERSVFNGLAHMLRKLCVQLSVPTPRIYPARPSDPCDHTDEHTVRFKITDEDRARNSGVYMRYHARHVLGHWLCDVHAAANERTDDPKCDLIADVIANLLSIATDDTTGEPR